MNGVFFRCGADTVGILCNFGAYALSDGVHLKNDNEKIVTVFALYG